MTIISIKKIIQILFNNILIINIKIAGLLGGLIAIKKERKKIRKISCKFEL